jgi:hypothetical protein
MTEPQKGEMKAEELKAQAEVFLTKLLKHKNDLFAGTSRELVVLAMCGFGCEVVEQELKRIFSETRSL